jgi:long-chain acyl-CoA synthetase
MTFLQHTIFSTFRERARHAPEAVAISRGSMRLTYTQVLERAALLGETLVGQGGVRPGDTVAVVSEVQLYWSVASLAIQAAAAVELPRETAIDAKSLLFLQQRTGFRVMFVESPQVLERVLSAELADVLRLVIPLKGDPQSVEDLFAPATDGEPRGSHAPSRAAVTAALEAASQRNRELSPDSTAAIIRTSGTTGLPKLVPLSHTNLLHSSLYLPALVELDSADVFLSCLPPWHLYARVVEYAAQAAGARIEYCAVDELAARLPEVRPTIFPGFPEIWEALFHRILYAMESRGRIAQIFHGMLALSRTRRRFSDIRRGIDATYRQRSRLRASTRRVLALLVELCLRPPDLLFDLLVYRRVRDAVGGRLRAAVIGDAPLPRFIDESLRALGFPVLEGYGSTEQCVVAIRSLRRNVSGSVGAALPETELRIHAVTEETGQALPPGAIGEVLVRGPQVFAGYLDPVPDTQPFAFVDGQKWYRSGDLGSLDVHGGLRIVGRVVHRFRTPDGRLESPEELENVLRASRYIERVVVLDVNGHPVALIVPDVRALLVLIRDRSSALATRLTKDTSTVTDFAAGSGEAARLLRVLPRLPVIQATLQRDFAALFRSAGQQSRAPERYGLMTVPFLPGRELTPTLKPARRRIVELYGEAAVALLAGSRTVTAVRRGEEL